MAGFLLALAASAGCDSGGDGAGLTTVTDSAGIEIVTNGGPGWSTGEAWTVAPEPALEIGGADPREEYQLFRVSDAVRLSDGRIAVGNGGSAEVRFYDAAGGYLSASGGQGEGPGEFLSTALIHLLPADTLLVVDPRLDRVSLLDARGAFIGSYRPPAARSGYAFATGAFPDGSMLMQGGETFGPGSESGYLRRDMPVYVARRGAEGLDSLGAWPGIEWYVDAEGSSVSLRAPPFGRQTHLAVGEEGWYAGASDSYEVEYLTPRGDLRRIIRRDVESTPTTPGMIEAAIGERLASVRSDNLRRRARRAYDAMEHPATLPAFGHLMVDAAENLWVMRYAVPGQPSQPWDVFSPGGRFMGTVELPPRLRVFEIGNDYVLALLRDELDVESVRLFRIEKPGD